MHFSRGKRVCISVGTEVLGRVLRRLNGRRLLEAFWTRFPEKKKKLFLVANNGVPKLPLRPKLLHNSFETNPVTNVKIDYITRLSGTKKKGSLQRGFLQDPVSPPRNTKILSRVLGSAVHSALRAPQSREAHMFAKNPSKKKTFSWFLNLIQIHGRLIFIHLQCWEVLRFCRFQRQWCINILCPKDPDFYTPLALKKAKGQHPSHVSSQTKRAGEQGKEGKRAINLSNLGKFCQIWPRAIYLCWAGWRSRKFVCVRPVGSPENTANIGQNPNINNLA